MLSAKDKVTTNIRLPREVYDRAKRLSQDTGLSLNWMVQEGLIAFLEAREAKIRQGFQP